MRGQLTPAAAALLVATLVVFWTTVAVLVRRHRIRRANAHGPMETRG